jgi:tryptophan-rich sensory protein
MVYKYGSLAAFLLLVVCAAYVGASFEVGEWYHETLNKPSWNPPAWVFGPVWSVLYLLMALSAWKVWLGGQPERFRALGWWLAQLVLNAGWSWLFFGMHRPGWAWVEMTLLIAIVIVCIRAFRGLSKSAANLMVPYLVWLIFAWVLNLAVWTMNGGLFSRVLLGGDG